MALRPEVIVRRFVVRVRRRSALAGAVEGLAAAAVFVLGLLLVLRVVFPVGLAPGLWVAIVLGAGALLGAVLRLRRAPFSRDLGAAHLDQRLGLQGLLLTDREAEAAAWRPTLDAALARAADAHPTLLPTHLLRRGLVAALAVAASFLLPARAPAGPVVDPLGQEALEEIQAQLDALEENAAIEEEKAEAIQERLDALEAGLEKDGFLAWTDLDALERRLEQEEARHAGDLAKAMEGLTDFAANPEPEGGAEAAQGEMAALLESAAAAGLLDKLPPDLRAKLGLDGATGGIDPSKLPQDLETLRQLAAALAATAGQALDRLGAQGALSAADLEALEQRLADAIGTMQAMKICKLCDGSDEDCPG